LHVQRRQQAQGMARPSENEIIAEIFAPFAGEAGLGLADDAACLTPKDGHDLVLTCDTVTAGVHFVADDPAAAIAAKALRVNLSDLAAKGAEPLGFLLNLALPQDWTREWLEAFAAGLAEEAELHACPLVGGDTVKILGPLTVSITAFGAVPHGRLVPRLGAQAGDVLFVTGTIGDAALGLLLRRPGEKPAWAQGLSQKAREDLVSRYLYPQPRLALREALRAHANAAMDISDGLAGDLGKMLGLAGMTADIAFAHLPLSPAAGEVLAQAEELAAAIVSGGDDYEILAAVPAQKAASFERQAEAAGVAVTRLGRVTAGKSAPIIRDKTDRPLDLATSSFQHF
jgi:thiamine-monophosphate kinase